MTTGSFGRHWSLQGGDCPHLVGRDGLEQGLAGGHRQDDDAGSSGFRFGAKSVQWTGVDLIKLFWRKFTYSFL
jgi:hypothetical protein